MKIPARGRKSGFVIVWEFYIRANKRAEFEKVYGPRGKWARFFRTGAGYIRTDLIRDINLPNRYLTLDYWKSRRHYESFRKKNRAAYLEIDEQCAALTTKEQEIGWFTVKL